MKGIGVTHTHLTDRALSFANLYSLKPLSWYQKDGSKTPQPLSTASYRILISRLAWSANRRHPGREYGHRMDHFLRKRDWTVTHNRGTALRDSVRRALGEGAYVSDISRKLGPCPNPWPDRWPLRTRVTGSVAQHWVGNCVRGTTGSGTSVCPVKPLLHLFIWGDQRFGDDWPASLPSPIGNGPTDVVLTFESDDRQY